MAFLKHCAAGFGAVVIGLTMAASPLVAGTACQLGTQPYAMTVADGASVTLYSAPSVPKGSTCDTVAVTETCTAGVLAGAPAGKAPFAGCIPLAGFTGTNLNNHPRQMDPRMVQATGTPWVRAYIDILNARDEIASGKAATALDPAEWKTFEDSAANSATKTILSLKWDFKQARQRPPLPGSAEEQALFDFLDRQILDPLAPSTAIIVSGNEPFVNTGPADFRPDKSYGGIPLVVFYQRVTAHVNDYLVKHGLRGKVRLFVGAFNRLDMPDMQNRPAVQQLLDFAQKTPFVDGVDLHTHVKQMDQIGTALAFAQSQTTKPVIVTEYTYVFKMQAGLAAQQPLGAAFTQTWKLPTDMTDLEFLRCEVFHRAPSCRTLPTIPKPEWDDFIKSRPWFIDHFLLKADAIFKAHGVLGATYGLVDSDPGPNALQPDRTPWYLTFLYSSATLGTGADGLPLANYQSLDDMRALNGVAN